MIAEIVSVIARSSAAMARVRVTNSGGAAALGRDDVGVLASGMLADLLIVSLDSVFVAPVHRVPSALVYCATPADITHVVVGGRVLIDDGDVVGVDENALVAQATAAAAEVFRRAGVDSRLSRVL